MAVSNGQAHVNIPGYYFNREKKRYFKIPPKADKSLYPNIITKQAHKAKKPRINENTQNPKVTRHANSHLKRLNLVHSQQRGLVNGLQFIGRVEMTRWQLPRYRSLAIDINEGGPVCEDEHLCLSQNGEYLIRKYSIASTNLCESRFGIYSVSVNEDNKSLISFNKIFQFSSYHSFFSGFDWASVSDNLWTLSAFQRSGPFNSNSSTLLAFKLVRSLGSEPGVRVLQRPWNMEESPWDICTNTSPYTACGQFGIGGETRQHLYDVERKMRYSYSTNSVTVLSQGFCRYSPFLVSGLRNGKALIWDLRSFPSYPAGVMLDGSSYLRQLVSPLIWVKPVLNDVYVIVQKQNGELALWDTRNYRKCVVYNHSRPDSQLGLMGYRGFLTESEQVLIGFPQGAHKPVVYDVMSGGVIQNRGTLNGLKGDDVSRYCYGSNWGGINGLEGLLESSSTGQWRFLQV